MANIHGDTQVRPVTGEVGHLFSESSWKEGGMKGTGGERRECRWERRREGEREEEGGEREEEGGGERGRGRERGKREERGGGRRRRGEEERGEGDGQERWANLNMHYKHHSMCLLKL